MLIVRIILAQNLYFLFEIYLNNEMKAFFFLFFLKKSMHCKIYRGNIEENI